MATVPVLRQTDELNSCVRLSPARTDRLSAFTDSVFPGLVGIDQPTFSPDM